MQEAIEIKNVSVTIGRTKILNNITATFPRGEIIGLLGPSGAGKTTLIRSIVGRQRVVSGTIDIFGTPAGSARLRSDIGYMTQEISVYSDLTVRENLHYFAIMGRRTKQQAEEVMREVDLLPQANQLFKTLSGGQKSRVSLAVALLGHPPILVLDEPTVGIDPVLRSRLWRLFNDISQSGTTIIVSSHVMDEASHCTKLALIRNGALLSYSTPNDLLMTTQSKTIEEGFLKLVEK